MMITKLNMNNKIIAVISTFLFICIGADAQNLIHNKLPNGMTVYIYEDHTQPDVFGQVIVHAGAYDEPAEYTGLAHYLEHVMFKGTRKIGALNWAEEEPIYNEIIAKYDKMADTADPAAKKAISDEINELTVKAGKISMTQEYSNLIESIGGNGLNAGTSHDMTVYYNSFPGRQLGKWMAVASERFINPVFRTFQSELETVYEEYNMYADNPQSQLSKFILSKVFEGSPYERNVIGLGEHLKNPRLSQLIKFYEDWYVPENMALVLVGDVDAKAAYRYAMSTFARIPAKPAPEHKSYPGFKIKGRVPYSTKLSDYPSIAMFYDGVKEGDPDYIPLEICISILSNNSDTGILDNLTTAGEVMYAGASDASFLNQGRIQITAVPYYDQAQRSYDSSKKVEKLLLGAINDVKNGNFSDATLESIKRNICRDFDLSFESNEGKANQFLELFLTGKSIEDLMSYKDKIMAVTKDDVIRVAKRFLNGNYLIFDNEIGRPVNKSDKIAKPGYKPIEPPVGQSSAYATWFKGRQAPDVPPSFVDWSIVQTKQVNSYSKLYYTPCNLNDVFTLVLKYGANSKVFPELEEAASLMNSAGIMSQYKSDELKREFARIGATIAIGSDDEYLYVTLRGYDSVLKDACLLLTKLLLMPSLDEKQLNNMIGSLATTRATRLKNVDAVSDALKEYLLYGDESPYRKEITDSKIINLDISSLTGDIVKATRYAAEIHYSGRLSFSQVSDILCNNLPLVEGENPSTSPWLRPMKEYSENTVIFVPSSEAKQAKIWFYIPCGDYDKSANAGRMAFNQYFSGGFNGLVMQEIREKNSMAYSTYGMVTGRNLPNSKVYFQGYIGTQNDKALNAIELYTKLLTDMPEHSETIGNIKTYLHEALLNKPSVRGTSQTIAKWVIQGYDDDPSKELLPKIDALTFEDIVAYYKANVQGKPIVIGIVGDPRQINAKDLAKFGKVIKLNDRNLFNETDVLF